MTSNVLFNKGDNVLLGKNAEFVPAPIIILMPEILSVDRLSLDAPSENVLAKMQVKCFSDVDGTILYLYRTGTTIKTIVAKIVNDVLVYGTEQTVVSSISDHRFDVDIHTSELKFVVTYRNPNDNNYSYAVAGAVDPATLTVSTGTDTLISTTAASATAIKHIPATDDYLVVGSLNSGFINIISVSGTTITLPRTEDIISEFIYSNIDLYWDSGNSQFILTTASNARTVTVSGTNISINTPVDITSPAGSREVIRAAIDSANGKMLVIFNVNPYDAQPRNGWGIIDINGTSLTYGGYNQLSEPTGFNLRQFDLTFNSAKNVFVFMDELDVATDGYFVGTPRMRYMSIDGANLNISTGLYFGTPGQFNDRQSYPGIDIHPNTGYSVTVFNGRDDVYSGLYTV